MVSEDGLWSLMRFSLKNVAKASTANQLAAALEQAVDAIRTRHPRAQVSSGARDEASLSD